MYAIILFHSEPEKGRISQIICSNPCSHRDTKKQSAQHHVQVVFEKHASNSDGMLSRKNNILNNPCLWSHRSHIFCDIPWQNCDIWNKMKYLKSVKRIALILLNSKFPCPNTEDVQVFSDWWLCIYWIKTLREQLCENVAKLVHSDRGQHEALTMSTCCPVMGAGHCPTPHQFVTSGTAIKCPCFWPEWRQPKDFLLLLVPAVTIGLRMYCVLINCNLLEWVA